MPLQVINNPIQIELHERSPVHDIGEGKLASTLMVPYCQSSTGLNGSVSNSCCYPPLMVGHRKTHFMERQKRYRNCPIPGMQENGYIKIFGRSYSDEAESD